MKTRALLLALPAVVLAVAACKAENHASVNIQAICYPTTTCSFSSTCDKHIIGPVTMDFSRRTNAPLVLQVQNQLQDNSSTDTSRVNTHDAHVDQVSVDYSGLPLPSVTYDVTNQGIPANGNSVIMVAAIYPSAANQAILQAAFPGTNQGTNLVAKIRLRGYYDDGSRFETGDFQTGLQVCNGCLSASPCGPGLDACPGIGMDPVACGSLTQGG
jgi:hypothetical protein